MCRLYRGVVPPLLGVTPIFAVSFWVGLSLGKVKRNLRVMPGLRHVKSPYLQGHTKPEYQGAFGRRVRGCWFPLCDTHYTSDSTSRESKSASAGACPLHYFVSNYSPRHRFRDRDRPALSTTASLTWSSTCTGRVVCGVCSVDPPQRSFATVPAVQRTLPPMRSPRACSRRLDRKTSTLVLSFLQEVWLVLRCGQ